MKNKIINFLQESVAWLQKEQEGCCRYILDDHIAIFMGWSGGYGDEKRDDVIQAEDNPDYGINVGIKVWTSDYMQTDYDWINFPYYENGEVVDLGLSITLNENYEEIADTIIKWYDEVKDLELNDDGMILEEETK